MPVIFYSLRGTSDYRKKHMGQIQGHYSIYNKYTGQVQGRYAIIDVYEKYTGEIKGHYAILRKYEGEIKGRYRSAQDAVDLYELYRGVDAMPDFDAAPWETFASFPHETAALDASHVYYFVLRKRNKYGVLSENTTPTIITIDAGGDQITNAPSNADHIELVQVAEMSANVSAIYNSRQDDDPADTWLLYLTDSGANPNPAVDSPYEIPMAFEGGSSWLDYDYGPKPDGVTVKAIIRTRVSGYSDADSDDSTIYSLAITDDAPPEIEAFIMNDDIYGNAQVGSISALGLNFDFESDLDGIEYITNDGEITQAKLKQLNDVPGDNLNTDLWDTTGDVTESDGKWSITASAVISSLDSAAAFNMFQYADVRFVVNIPGDEPSLVYTRLRWHANLFISIARGGGNFAWQILDTGGVGNLNDSFAFTATSYAVRLSRTTGDVIRIEYRTDIENVESDTGWTLAKTSPINGTHIALETGHIEVDVQGDLKSAEVPVIWKNPESGDNYYPISDLEPITYLRSKAFSWAAHDPAGVNVSNVEMDETIPADCGIHYVYTSNSSGTRPNKATMVALSHYTSFATFKTALEADAGLDEYLYIGVILYGPTVTDPAYLNKTTPIISSPVLDY